MTHTVATARDTHNVIEIPGPWQHRYVAANGARFHVAESVPAGVADPPLVVLLHGFPEFWWAWRDQLPALAATGFRTAAMDLRGYGGSDKTPRGYDPVTLAQDVAGVVKALGERSAVVVGHGWGGYVGWAAAALHPREVSAFCAVSAPHPRDMLRSLRPGRAGALAHVLAMQVPRLPERRLANPGSGFLGRHLREWSAPGSAFPDAATVETYQDALKLWPAPHCALEYHRWLLRSRLRADGRRFNHLMERPVLQPVCLVDGAEDPALPARTSSPSPARVRGPLHTRVLAGAGHFPHEERPAEFTDVLLDWLGGLDAG
ncbi:MAG TPA: alpha/beta hydrolase [Nocardioidaceae bacterium]|nr:alpha/beta hydrolase [Nocardioidaceae bacterium]